MQYKYEPNLDDPLLGLPREEADRLLRGFGEDGGHSVPAEVTEARERGEGGEANDDTAENNIEIPIPAFPMEILPDDFRRYVDSASISLGVPGEVFATMALTTLSSCIGNAIRIAPKKDFRVAPFLWSVIVMPSGSGKSPALTECARPVMEAQLTAYAVYKDLKGIYESELDAYRRDKGKSLPCPEKPVLEHFYTDDITVETLADVFEGQPRGVLSWQDELSSLVCGMNQYRGGGGNDRQHYLTLFNCQPLKIDRKTGSRVISNTGSAILGGIQPLVLPEIMDRESFTDGFIQRFLFCYPDVAPSKFSRESISDEPQEFWERLISWCLGIPLEKYDSGRVKPTILMLSPAALDRWIVFYDQYAELQTILPPKMDGFIPKLHIYSLKFAGILHVLKGFVENRHIPAAIDLETIEGAVKLTRYFFGQAQRIVGLFGEKKEVNGQHQRILKALHNLRGSVAGGMLVLSRIVEEHNKGLPDYACLTARRIGHILRKELGLITRNGVGNRTFLLWEAGKLEGLLKTKLTTSNKLTTPDDQNDPEVNKLTSLTSSAVDSGEISTGQGQPEVNKLTSLTSPTVVPDEIPTGRNGAVTLNNFVLEDA